jgi:hypothetical protein
MARTRSGGPRTIAGKTRSSLNALRHGLATRLPRQTAPPDAVDRLAQAICGGKDDAELLAAARAIAETSFVLHAIRQQKIMNGSKTQPQSRCASLRGFVPSIAGLNTTAIKSYPRTTCQLVMMSPDELTRDPDPSPSLVATKTTEGEIVR